MKKLIIFLLLPVLAHAQHPKLFDLSSMQAPAAVSTPTLSLSTLSITGLNATTGTAGTGQNDIATWANITGGSGLVTVTPVDPVEVSGDGGSTWNASAFSFSTGSPKTLVLRIKASASVGAVSVTINVSASGVTTQPIAVTGTVSAIPPTLTTSPTSVSGLNSTAGTAGTASTVTATFANGTFLATPPTGVEISKDGGSTYAGSQTFSTGSPLALKIRNMASDAAGAISGNLAFTGSGFTTLNVGVTGTVSASATAIAKFNFSTTSVPLTGWTNAFGRPTTGFAYTDAGTGWTLTCNSTEWGEHGGFYGDNSSGGCSSGCQTYGSDFPDATTIQSYLINEGGKIYSGSGTYPFTLSNLASGSYTIYIMSGQKSSFYANTGYSGEFDWLDATGTNQFTNVSFSNNNSVVVSFTIVVSGGTIKFGPYQNRSNGNFTPINNIVIRKTS